MAAGRVKRKYQPFLTMLKNYINEMCLSVRTNTEFVTIERGAPATGKDLDSIRTSMMKYSNLMKLIPSFHATLISEDKLKSLIKTYLPTAKPQLSKFDIFFAKCLFNRTDRSFNECLDTFFSIAAQPYLSEVFS